MIPILPPQQTIPNVPFHSQLTEIKSSVWRLQGCGITSLSMIIDFYKPKTVSLNTLLNEGIALGAYINNVGWSYNGLIKVAEKYDLTGKTYDLSNKTNEQALIQLIDTLQSGPVIASVQYKLDPKSPLPHLVVIDGISNNTIYYNDPDAKTGKSQISTEKFLKGWKKRFIVIRPKINNLTSITTKKKHV